MVKNLPAKRHGLDSGSRVSPEEGNENSLQYSGLENLMDRGTWWATVQAARSHIQLSD